MTTLNIFPALPSAVMKAVRRFYQASVDGLIILVSVVLNGVSSVRMLGFHDRPEASRARQKFPLHRLVLAPPARLSKVELRQLSRQQRKRRREGMYWDNVLAHTVRQNVREEKARLLKQERDDWRVLTENYDKPRARDSASPRMDCKRRLAFMFRCCRSCLSHPPRENKVPQ